MAISTREEVARIYVATFQRAADSDGLDFWVGKMENDGWSIEDVAASFFDQEETMQLYPHSLSDEGFITAAYDNIYGREPDDAGLEYWLGDDGLGGGMPRNEMLIALVNGASTPTDVATLSNRSEISLYFADSGRSDVADGYSAMMGVTSDYGTVITAKANIDAMSGGPVEVEELRLTTGVDILEGTGADDVFIANVVQNINGEQVNSLGSGDELDGGSGNDMLAAKITTGSFAGDSGGGESMPIQPETVNIENIQLEAVNAFIGNNVNSTEVYVNAKDMLGVDKIASHYSDANLTIQNMTTLADDGTTIRELSDLTVGMEYTGNADSRWNESDLHVYFDQDYLNPSATFTDPSVDFRLMNEDAYDQTNTLSPLGGVYVALMDVHLNGETFHIADYIEEDLNGTGMEISTYQDLLDTVADAVVLLKADNLDNAALQTLEVSNGGTFLSDISPVTGQQRVGTTVTLTVDGATNGEENSLTVEATDLVLDPTVGAVLDNSNRYERAEQTPTEEGQVLSINIDLEKAGLAGDGGELVVGSMFKDGSNEFSDLYDGAGIEQFDVTVYGGDEKPSSLSALRSTGNNLKVVNVTTAADQTDTFASLTIGNSESNARVDDNPHSSNANVLKDIQTFDASGFKGDLTIWAGLTEEVTAKYLDRTDDAFNPAADNVAFEYTGGMGNDYINLNLDASNLAAAGTSSREDMTLTVNGGAGDDTLITDLDDNQWQGDNWYANQKINADLKMLAGAATGQLQVNGGFGDDTIRTLGTGDMAINGGAGNDTIYADNTDDFAVWVVNAVVGEEDGDDIDNLLSEEASETSQTNVVNLQLTVVHNGFESTVDVGAVNGGTSGVAITDLTINQAIKDAINNDAVLSKLLIAEDGPARTLVISSLVDGDDQADDYTPAPTISLSSTPLTAGQAALGATVALISDAQSAALGFNADDGTANADRYTPDELEDGDDSDKESDNLIVGGLGDDVIVLGTGEDSNDTIGYAGFGNGTDSIVNFTSSEVGFTLANTAVVTVTVQGQDAGEITPETFETFEMKVSGASTTNTLITVGPSYQVAVEAGDTAAEVAAKIVAGPDALPGGTYDEFDATLDPTDPTIVIFTANVPGNVADPRDTGTIPVSAWVDTNGSGVVITMDNFVNGSLEVAAPGATNEVFTVTFGNATIDGDVAFNGDSVPVLAGNTGAEVAYSVASGIYDDWDVSHTPLTNVVTFTAKVAGDVTDVTDADFVGANIEVGLANVDPDDMDMIDFTSYDVEGVTVDGNLITGVAADADGENYIVMSESATNDGEYEIEVFEFVEDAADISLGVVGIADFGEEQVFVEANFIII